MRWHVGSSLALVTLLAAFRPTLGEESMSAAEQPEPRYSVLCRLVDENGNASVGPLVTLAATQAGLIRIGSSSSSTETTLELAVSPAPQLNGVQRLEIQVSQSTTTDGTEISVCARQSAPTGQQDLGPLVVRTDHVKIEKKEISVLVRQDDIVAIPLGDAHLGSSPPRLEVVVQAKEEKIPPEWLSPPAGGPAIAADAPGKEVLNALLASGSARIRWERVSRWAAVRGHDLFGELQPLRDSRDCLTFYRLFVPHRPGVAEVSCLLLQMLEDRDRVARLEAVMTGCEWMCSVDLWDSPRLVDNVELLRRLPAVWNLVVRGEPYDRQLARGLEHVNVLGSFERGSRTAAVQYSHHDVPHDSSHQEAMMDNAPPQMDWCISHTAPGRPQASLMGTVFAKNAESAIPYFQTQSDLRHVLIIAPCEEDAEQAIRAEAAIRQALPKVTTETFVFSGHRSAKN